MKLSCLNYRKSWKSSISIIVFFAIASLGLFVSLSPAGATPTDVTDGSILFERYCAGCHPQGDNIVRRRKTLKLKSLERDGYDAIEPLSDLVTKGLNNMPGFADQLQGTQIETLSQFVLDQANNGWRKN
ncbi:MAG: cytochrome C6 [Acaryochloridaceae cyanobacterium CSU_3_4]|nr:cytochrome C6 [Acaryochloridaceae cyanobacterium CSU_3_4]